MRFFPGIVRPVISFNTPPGSRVLIHHEARFDGERTIIVDTGTSDIQDAINSYAPFCDINYMLSRLKVGDRTVLNPASPMYGDFSGLPTNPHDIINVVRGAESSFNQLSAEERASCNNDFRVWLSRRLRPSSGPASPSDAVSSSPSSGSVADPKTEV